MAIMEYDLFKQIFNETIFEKSKVDLLQKIAKYPMRYIGLFRPSRPKAKILQNLLQSHEIRFGDAFEKIIEEYLKINGCKILPKQLILENKELLNIDQFFKYKNRVYFIEQKIRDDHDSTKKRGQSDNFEKKLTQILTQFPNQQIISILYFIDADFGGKNQKYYTKELKKMSNDYQVETQIFYGKPLFDYLGFPEVWDEILEYLEKWRKEIPDLPEINFDLEAEQTFQEIKYLEPLYFRKLLDNDEIFNEIVLTLFPQKKTLQMLQTYFSSKQEAVYQTIASKLKEKLK